MLGQDLDLDRVDIVRDGSPMASLGVDQIQAPPLASAADILTTDNALLREVPAHGDSAGSPRAMRPRGQVERRVPFDPVPLGVLDAVGAVLPAWRQVLE